MRSHRLLASPIIVFIFVCMALVSAQTENVWTQTKIPLPYNVVSVLVDPVRPGDYYAFLINGWQSGNSNVVMKSVDFGLTWSVVYNSPSMIGEAWGTAIDPNPNRNSSTPPTIYIPSGYGSGGIFKSTDGGVTWTQLFTEPTVFDPYSNFGGLPDVYSVNILPDNPPNHILITFHGGWKNSNDAGIGESTDGGVTWTVHQPPTNFGQSQYMTIIDKNTWIIQSQWVSNACGIWRTTTGGRIAGVPSTSAWQQVSVIEHAHGQWQGYYDPASKIVYTTGVNTGWQTGVFRSLDLGATWILASQFSTTDLVATGNYIYAGDCGGPPNLMRTKRSDGVNWTSYCSTPDSMTGLGASPASIVSSYNGTNWIIVGTSCTPGGLWRYVESSSATVVTNQAVPIVKSGVIKERGIRLTKTGIAVRSMNGILYDVKGQNIRSK